MSIIIKKLVVIFKSENILFIRHYSNQFFMEENVQKLFSQKKRNSSKLNKETASNTLNYLYEK